MGGVVPGEESVVFARFKSRSCVSSVPFSAFSSLPMVDDNNMSFALVGVASICIVASSPRIRMGDNSIMAFERFSYSCKEMDVCYNYRFGLFCALFQDSFIFAECGVRGKNDRLLFLCENLEIWRVRVGRLNRHFFVKCKMRRLSSC